jgi:hypothetical protein
VGRKTRFITVPSACSLAAHSFNVTPTLGPAGKMTWPVSSPKRPLEAIGPSPVLGRPGIGASTSASRLVWSTAAGAGLGARLGGPGDLAHCPRQVRIRYSLPNTSRAGATLAS